MNPINEQVWEYFGYTVICEHPLEVETESGDIITDRGLLHFLFNALKEERSKQRLYQGKHFAEAFLSVHKQFQEFLQWGNETFPNEEELVERFYLNIIGSRPVIDEHDRIERGCFGGPCACTGRCQELRPATGFDVINQGEYDTKRDYLDEIMLGIDVQDELKKVKRKVIV